MGRKKDMNPQYGWQSAPRVATLSSALQKGNILVAVENPYFLSLFLNLVSQAAWAVWQYYCQSGPTGLRNSNGWRNAPVGQLDQALYLSNC